MNLLERVAALFNDPHAETMQTLHRANAVRRLVEDVGRGTPIPPERWRETRELLDRDDALLTMFGRNAEEGHES